MTALSVNLNKLALIRNARGENEPNIYEFAKRCLQLGCAGITVHPRPDQRHIRYDDLRPLANIINEFPNTEFNIEGYPSETFINTILTIQPHQVTLVPDPPEALTSSFGWEVKKHLSFLTDTIELFHNKQIRTSLFIAEDFNDLHSLRLTKTNRIEIFTGPYAKNIAQNDRTSLHKCQALAKACQDLSIEVNAGHDLNQKNIKLLLTTIPTIKEVSIGHALTCEALLNGWDKTIKTYLTLLK